MQLVGRGQLVRLCDRRDEDNLVFLGYRRDGGSLGRRKRAYQEVHLVLEDHFAGDAHRFVGGAFRVARDQPQLAAVQHAAGGIHLLD
jgi:hypothetical protein